IQVTVVLQPRTPMGHAAATPVSRERFAEVHGADPAAIEAIEGFANASNILVVVSHLDRRTVVLSGSIKDMERAFDVSLAHYESEGRFYRGFEGSISVPPPLEPLVVAVHGLDNRPAARPRLLVSDSHAQGHATAGGLYTPLQVATAYRFPL